MNNWGLKQAQTDIVQVSQQKIVNYKHQRKFKGDHYRKLKLMMNMGLIEGIDYIQTALLKLKLAKELFVLDLE